LADVQLHIGFDDTDSPRMGCTTYIGAILVERLEALGCKFTDYPNLIRLNPNVPWKTRGNGAVCLRVSCEDGSVDKVKDSVLETVKANSDLEYARTDPAVVFLEGDVSEDLRRFSKRVLGDIVTVNEAKAVASRVHADVHLIKGERGLVGALAAVGEILHDDFTYEIIAYRFSENRGTQRKVRRESILEMDRETTPFTFNNYDPKKRRILITPRGPDPILYGIRGETPEILLRAKSILVVEEDIERWVIYRCNHGTDAHLRKVDRPVDVRPHRPTIMTATVLSIPKVIPGGHVVFSIGDESGTVDCAAYEPTGEFREVVRRLIPGDVVKVFGGVREASSKNPVTINLEKIEIMQLTQKVAYLNPLCTACGKRTKSSGRSQGFRCPRCSATFPLSSRIATVQSRDLEKRLYIPPARAHRHLTKPYSRYGREKNVDPESPVVVWHGS